MKRMKKLILCIVFLPYCLLVMGQIQAGRYTIRLSASGKALDADFTNRYRNDCKIHLWSFNKDSETQNWNITKIDSKAADNPNNLYKITLAISSKALDADPTNFLNNECRVRLWDDKNGINAQAWIIKSLGNNKYQIVLAVSGKALDADGPNINNNDCIVHLWDKRNDGFKTQTWLIETSKPIPVPPPPPVPKPMEGVVRDHRTDPVTVIRYAQWNNLRSQPQKNFDDAMQKHQGIIAMDALFPTAAYIGAGNVSVEYAPLHNRPTHIPIDGYKRPHTGFGIGFNKGETDFTGDNDVTCYIFPNAGNTYYEDKINSGTTKARKVEGEIDILDKFWPTVKNYLPKPYNQITAYGAWVHENHNYWDTRRHDYLEIHPMENVWWTTLMANRLAYRIVVFSDSSFKFTKWTPNPVLAVNAIAFEYVQGQPPLRFKMSMRAENNIIKYPNYDDEVESHSLLDIGESILTVEEPLGLKNKISVDFEKVSKVFNTQINKYVYKGFVKIHTAVKEGGLAVFDVVEMNTIHSYSPKRIKVTMEKITCIAADDDGGDEELFGRYGVGAVSGLLPYFVNIKEETNGGNGNVLWDKSKSNHISLKQGQVADINSSVIFPLPISGEIIIYGNLDEEDGIFNDDDKLGEEQIVHIKVQDIISKPIYRIEHYYKSGGTNIRVDLRLEIIN
jgi:Ricin-type beta-trefoil lectin domain-like